MPDNPHIPGEQTGTEFGEAIDLYPSKYTYTISENKIEEEENE